MGRKKNGSLEKKKTSNYFKMNEDITAGLGEKFIFI